MKMVKMLPQIVDARPEPPKQSDASADLTSLWQLTEGLGPDLWQDAGMPDLVHYLLGAKGLCVPKQWEWLIPSHI